MGKSLDDLTVVVLVDHDAQLRPGSTAVTLVSVNGDMARAAPTLLGLPRPDLILDASSQVNRIKLFKAVFWSLADGGHYVAINPGRLGLARWILCSNRLRAGPSLLGGGGWS